MKKHQLSLCTILLAGLMLTLSPTALARAGSNFQTAPDTPTATETQTVTFTTTATSTATLPVVATPTPTMTPTPPAGARPVIVLSSYSTGEVLIGKEFTLNAQFKNTGQVDAYNIIITFMSDGFVPLGNGGVQSISNIGVNNSGSISQKFVPSYSLIGSASSTIELTINYTDIYGTPFTGTFTLLINFKTYASGGALSATRTPTAIPQPQLIIAFYETDLGKLQAGNSFKLTIHVQNMGNADALNVTMVLGGATLSECGTPQPSGVSGGSADLSNFAPLGTSNLYFLDKIASGQTVQQTIDLVVNVSTDPGAYPLKISFSYVNPSGNATIDDQVITLLVYNLPNLTASYYQPVGDLYVGQPGIMPMQITNVGKRSIVLSEMDIIPSSGSMSNNKISVGTIDPGGYFTVDSEFIPDMPGEVIINLTISYTDDFTNPSTLRLTLPTLNVVEMAFLPDEGGLNGGGEFVPEQPVETPLSWWQILLGFLGLTTGK
jgi:hypothetical protein